METTFSDGVLVISISPHLSKLGTARVGPMSRGGIISAVVVGVAV